VEIVVYNRAILLFTTDSEAVTSPPLKTPKAEPRSSAGAVAS